MLEQLLNEIRKGSTLQPAALASRLNLSTAMVEAMLADLERRGMLLQVDTSCGEACGGCPMDSSCGTQGGKSRLWMLIKPKRA